MDGKKAIIAAQGVSSPSLYLGELAVMDSLKPNTLSIQPVPNFIDTEQFSPGKLSNESQSTLVLYAGRLESLKGAMILAKAIPQISSRYPQAHFAFLGADRLAEDGTSQKAQLERFLERAGLRNRVEFQGHSSSEVFLSYYRQASVFVLPSVFENYPYTLLEAMSCEKACVVSRAGGMIDMVEEGKSGLFFEPGNPEDLAEKVIALLDDPTLRTSLGVTARQRVVQKYGLDIGVEKTLSFYQSILGKPA